MQKRETKFLKFNLNSINFLDQGGPTFYQLGLFINLSKINGPQNYMYMKFSLFSI